MTRQRRRNGAGTDRLAMTEEPLVVVLDRLRSEGFDADFQLDPGAIPPAVCCRRCGRRHLPEVMDIDELHRFEGPSSPDDEAVLLALHCPRCGAHGTLVSAYGPAASAEEADLLTRLADRTRQPNP